jgi:hypothetical protein
LSFEKYLRCEPWLRGIAAETESVLAIVESIKYSRDGD